MGLLSQLFNKPGRVALSIRGGQLLLQCFYDDHAAAFSEVVEKWPRVGELRRYFPQEGAAEATVPVGEIERLRGAMDALQASHQRSRLLFDVAADIRQAAIRDGAPDGFRVRYVRQGSGLRRELPEGTRLLAEGWFLLDSACWRYGGLPAEALECLTGETVAPERLLPFLKEGLPALRKAGVAVESELTYDPTPALRLELREVSRDGVTLRPRWAIAPARVEADTCLPGHVLADGVVRPGIMPEALCRVLPRPEADRRLEGAEVAAFLDGQMDAWRPFLTGDTALFEQAHRWAQLPFSWLLRVTPGESGGECRPIAEPVARIGSDRVTVKELGRAQREAYWHFPGGWARQEDLRGLGLSEKNRISGAGAAAPFVLSPRQLLHRGDASLAGPWVGMETDGPTWVTAGGKHSCAAGHLAYLTGWGLRGGLVGGYEAMTAYGLPFVTRYLSEHREAQALIVGNHEDVEALQKGAIPLRSHLLPYPRVGRDDRANTTQWDLLLLIEPEGWRSAVERNHILEAARLSVRHMLVFCHRRPAELGFNQQAWLAALLGCGKTPEVLPYLIRDCRQPMALPEPYRFAAEEPAEPPTPGRAVPGKGGYSVGASPRDGVANITLAGAAPRSEPVPPRPVTVTPLNAEKGARFLQEARKLVHYVPETASPAPFSCYWPVYADMDARQQVWYFHLRALWRRGEYPDADASYLFVHVYELLQLVGASDARDGYRQLLALWKGYRDRVSALDGHLDEWLGDYIHIYDCGVTDAQLLAEAPAVSDRVLNAALSAMADELPLNVPLWALERLSGYRPSKGKFWQQGHDALLREAIPDAVTWVDEQLRLTTGKGLLNTCAPLPWHSERVTAFANAPVAEGKLYELRLRRYEAAPKLSEYLRHVMRGTENLLRARRGYSARLPGVELDEQTRGWLERYVDALLPRKDQPAVPVEDRPRGRITLDLSQLSQLRDDSDAVREALLASVDEPEPGAADAASEADGPDEQPPTLPPDEPAPQTAAEPDAGWQAFFRAADLEALRAAMAGEAALAAYARARRQMPDVVMDELNSLAQDTIGDLIVDAEGVTEEYRAIVEAHVRKE